MSSLEKVIVAIRTDLMAKNKIREETHEAMRKATSLSKQAILLIHQKRLADAETMVTNAKELITKLQAETANFPDLIYGGMMSAAQQEYAEANILLTLVKEDRYVNPEEIHVPQIDYVLGLADVIGEYRRLALDALRDGEVEKGVRCLEIMDEIFIQLLALDEAYMLVPGLRHKSDTQRRVIESTRGDISLEVRRKSLEDYLKKFTPPEADKEKTAKTERKRVKAKK